MDIKEIKKLEDLLEKLTASCKAQEEKIKRLGENMKEIAEHTQSLKDLAKFIYASK